MLLHLTVLFHFTLILPLVLFHLISITLCVFSFWLLPYSIVFPVNCPWGKALTNKMYYFHHYYYYCCYLWAQPPRTEWWADDQLWQKQGNAAGHTVALKHCTVQIRCMNERLECESFWSQTADCDCDCWKDMSYQLCTHDVSTQLLPHLCI